MPSGSNLPLSVPVWLRICDILSEKGDMGTLTTLMRVSDATYDLASPFVYRKAKVNERNIKSFPLGLKPSSRVGIKFPPAKKQRSDQRTAIYRPKPDTVSRKIRLLANITELELTKPPYNGPKRGRQLDRQTPILKWCLKHATQAASTPLLPHLRKISFINYPNDNPDPRYPITDLIVTLKRLHQAHRSPTTPFCTSTLVLSWDLCIWLSSINRWDSPVSLGLVSWLNSLLGRGVIRDLSIHHTDPAQFFPLRMSQWDGGLRVFHMPPTLKDTMSGASDQDLRVALEAENREFAVLHLVDLMSTSRYLRHPVQISNNLSTGTGRSTTLEEQVQRLAMERLRSNSRIVRYSCARPNPASWKDDEDRVAVYLAPMMGEVSLCGICREMGGAGSIELSC